ncbi:MAG: magnesium transporter CorA family protein [Deltaproteobacteria bacterium]|nr:magnesium transporter CorA family protein [Candidatus Zymogenaceae bacterium]
MLKKYNVIGGKLVETEQEDALLFIFINPDEGEKKHLVDDLKLDDHTLGSALDPDELARLEFEPKHAAIIFKRPEPYSHKDEFLFKIASTGAYLFKDRLVIVISEDVPLFDGIQHIKMATPGYLLLRLIYRSIHHFLGHVKVISAISDELQDKINRAMENRYLINLFSLQKSLVYYLNFINSNGVVLEKLKINAKKIGFSTEELELLDDTLIENNQCYRQAEIYSNILASLMDARASIVSNNLNVLMKTLTLITITIMVPTFVVSAFSMNVRIPLSNLSYAFWIILGLAATSVLGIILLWRRKGW